MTGRAHVGSAAPRLGRGRNQKPLPGEREAIIRCLKCRKTANCQTFVDRDGEVQVGHSFLPLMKCKGKLVHRGCRGALALFDFEVADASS